MNHDMFAIIYCNLLKCWIAHANLHFGLRKSTGQLAWTKLQLQLSKVRARTGESHKHTDRRNRKI